MRCFLGEVQNICEFIISTRSSLSDDAPQETQRPLFIFTGPIEIFTHPHTKGPLESLQMTTTRSMQLRAHQDNSHFTGRAHPHVPWRSIIIFFYYQCFFEDLQSAKQRQQLEEAWTRSCRTSPHTFLCEEDVIKKAHKARRCDSYLQIWNYQSLTHWQG